MRVDQVGEQPASRIFTIPTCVTARAHTLSIEVSGHVANTNVTERGQQVGRENRSLGGCHAAQARMCGIETIDSQL